MATAATHFVPSHLHALSPHLICRDAGAAMDFYKRAFGAEELVRMCSPDGKLMHGSMRVAGSTIMLVDEAPQWNNLGPESLHGTPVSIHIYVPDADAVYAQAIAAGATPVMPVADMFWGDRYGVLKDPYGHKWSIATHRWVMSPAETEAAMHAAFAAFAARSRAGSGEAGSADTFRIAQDLAAPRALVWQALTEEARLLQWWGPKGFTMLKATNDLRHGGMFHYGLRMPSGETMWGRFVYAEIVPNERMVFVNSFSDEACGVTRHPLAPTWPLRLLSTFALSDAGPGRTRLEVTWTPIDPTPEEAAAFAAGHASMRQGWTGTLEQLVAYLAQAQGEAAGARR